MKYEEASSQITSDYNIVLDNIKITLGCRQGFNYQPIPSCTIDTVLDFALIPEQEQYNLYEQITANIIVQRAYHPKFEHELFSKF